MPERFESKRDTWLVALIVASMVVMAVAIIALRTAPMDPLVRWGVIAALLATIALTGWLLASTYYLAYDDRLVIRSGPFRWRIALATIVSVTPTRAVWSSPALSLDRLRIDYGSGRWVLVSPRRREAFLAALRVTARSV